MIESREEVTKIIVATKVTQGIKWADVAKIVGEAKEWSTDACLGQMALNQSQVEALGKLFSRSDEAIAW